MAKTLKDFLNERQLGPMVVKNPDEQKFIDKHVVAKTADRNGNDDEVFKGSKVKMAERPKHRKGYNPGQDEEVYEGLSESTYEFDVSGEHGNAAVDKLVKHANSNGIKAKVHTYDGPGGGNPVIHLSHKDPKVVHSYAKKHIDPDVDLSDHKINEALKGAQHKIDANKNGKVDAHDFHLLRKKKKVAEEAEELDELSKKTLDSYTSKASGSLGFVHGVAKNHRYAQEKDPSFAGRKPEHKAMDNNTLRKRASGLVNSIKRLAKEEADQIDELSEPTVRTYYNKAGEQGKKIADKMKMGGGDWSKDGSDTKTLKKRAAGRTMALKRRSGEMKMSEEAEQVNEKDAPHVKDYGPYGGRASSAKEKMIADFNKPKNKNEKPNRYTKESRAMAVASKLTTQYGSAPLNKEERLLTKLADLAETHKRTMVSVFEKLNEDNQYAFMQACDTADGIEQMLDFSISYRGE